MNGIVLPAGDLDYGDMKKIGRIEIECDPHSGQVRISVDGFKFDEPPTCRMHATKAMAWARDLLTAQVEAQRLVPGGNVQCSIGT